jgi:SIR2-like domain
MTLEERDWKYLVSQINHNSCTPFIGAGASEPWLPSSSKIAQDWAKEYQYPLDDTWQLDKVAQFVGIVRDADIVPKTELCDRLMKLGIPDFSNYKDGSHAYLARMPFPIYITTNYDKFMEAALERNGRPSDSEYCRWNGAVELTTEDSIFTKSGYAPTKAKPLVYHLHGYIDDPQSMVLTERDYIYFLINLDKDEKIIPTPIRRALARKSLLFVGYSLGDINFRVIFQGIMSIVKPDYQQPSISVQLPPDIEDNKKEKALAYLNQYTRNMFKVNIHWGDAREFLSELIRRLEESNHGE